MHERFGWGKLKEGDNMEDLGVNESVILKGIKKIRMELFGLSLCDAGGEKAVRCREDSNELLSSIKCGQLLE